MPHKWFRLELGEPKGTLGAGLFTPMNRSVTAILMALCLILAGALIVKISFHNLDSIKQSDIK